MPRKKSVKRKKSTKKPKRTRSVGTAKTSSDTKIEKVLVENFVALQKVMTNLSGRFDNLANQISNLLDLFEISAKSLANKDFGLELGNNEELNKKVDAILDQNKTIARGLTLLHEPELSQGQVSMPPQRRPMQPMQRVVPRPRAPPNLGGLQGMPPERGSMNINPPAAGADDLPKDPRQTIDMTGYEKSLTLKEDSDSVFTKGKKSGLER